MPFNFHKFLSGAELATLIIFSTTSILARAETADDLARQISDNQNAIQKLDQEISAYQKAIGEQAGKATGLKQEIIKLDTEKAKLNQNILATKNKILQTGDELGRLEADIAKQERSIAFGRQALGEAIRLSHAREQDSLLDNLLTAGNLSDFWADNESLLFFNESVKRKLDDLRAKRAKLLTDAAALDTHQKQLGSLQNRLTDEKTIAESTQMEKNNLLKQTKSQETAYRQLLADREAKRSALEQEIFDFESRLKVTVDASKLPKAHAGLLKWPLATIKITQRFGKTVDAKRLYASGTHNGVDFAASIGTAVLAAEAGVITGVGDTDLTCPKASYGRWILLKHDNGLATLYAHLSLIKVKSGERVAVGQVIGYTGNTGYTTGPHLHLTVYAAEAVSVTSRASVVCKATYTMPVAPPQSYLDPLIYL